MPEMNKHRGRAISRRFGVAAAGVIAVVVIAIELAARTTRGSHNRRVSHLGQRHMKEKLKEKLDVDYKRYVILGACNPPLAYKALQAEPEIGLLLPCNVIVYEAEGDRSVVSAADPEAMLSIVGNNPAVAEVARDAKERLSKALGSL